MPTCAEAKRGLSEGGEALAARGLSEDAEAPAARARDRPDASATIGAKNFGAIFSFLAIGHPQQPACTKRTTDPRARKVLRQTW